MNKQSPKKRETIRLIVTNTIMAISVVVIATFVTLYMLGYRFNTSNGGLVQYAFLQFSSTPSGATVTIDGAVLGAQTPTKTSTPAGKHNVVMWRDGYRKWTKAVTLQAGTLTWLNYTLLVPEKLSVEPIGKYDSIHASLAALDNNEMIIQAKADTPQFDLINTSSDKVKTTTLILPATAYSAGINHTFSLDKWDDGGRYVLIKHDYDSKTEWLVMDTQNVESTQNISGLLDVSINKIVFDGTSGNAFYALVGSDVRALNLSAGTLSKPLISNVSSFDYYTDAKVITYIGTTSDGKSNVIGVYRDGDESASVIKTVAKSSSDNNLHITTTHYYNEYYVAISEANKIQIMSGSYPNTTDNTSSMKTIASLTTSENINDLSFSPSGEYLIAKNGAYFATYDLEYQTKAESTIGGNGTLGSLKWLDDNHLWSDRDGRLTIRDFDGKNVYSINATLVGQDVELTKNGRFLYSINKTNTGYQLQRVRMILP